MLTLRSISNKANSLRRNLSLRTVSIAIGALLLIPATRYRALPDASRVLGYFPKSSSVTRQTSITARMATLQEQLSSGTVDETVKLWFQDVTSDDQFIIPSRELYKRWFAKDEAFDKTCLASFGPCLEAIRSSQATADDIIAAVKPTSPTHWIGLVLLLDQIPRNAFRGDQARVAFEVFDPLAREIAKRAIAQGIPRDPAVRYRSTYLMWIYFPFMHSEDLQQHNEIAAGCDQMLEDIRALVHADEATLDANSRHVRKVLTENLAAANRVVEELLEYEIKHRVILEQFGRYPYRNKCLGREPTPEEEAYLRDGGETFASQ